MFVGIVRKGCSFSHHDPQLDVLMQRLQHNGPYKARWDTVITEGSSH